MEGKEDKMKKFTIEVKGASAGQLQTIATELKIMSNDWAKFGPRLRINAKPLEAPSLRMEVPSPKLQATSLKKNTIMW